MISTIKVWKKYKHPSTGKVINYSAITLNLVQSVLINKLELKYRCGTMSITFWYKEKLEKNIYSERV